MEPARDSSTFHAPNNNRASFLANNDTNRSSSSSTTTDSDSSNPLEYLSNSEGNIEEVTMRHVIRKSPFFQRKPINFDNRCDDAIDDDIVFELRPGIASASILEENSTLAKMAFPAKLTFEPKTKLRKRVPVSKSRPRPRTKVHKSNNGENGERSSTSRRSTRVRSRSRMETPTLVTAAADDADSNSNPTATNTALTEAEIHRQQEQRFQYRVWLINEARRARARPIPAQSVGEMILDFFFSEDPLDDGLGKTLVKFFILIFCYFFVVAWLFPRGIYYLLWSIGLET